MKKAQIKFGETIGIIIIVYLVLVFGLNWYNSANTSDLQELYEQEGQNRALEVYYTILYSDFLRKSQQGFERNYFDLTSVKAFQNYTQEEDARDILDTQLGEAYITLDLLSKSDFDANNEPEKLILYNNTREDEIERSYVFTSLVSVRDDERDSEKNLIGILRVEIPQYAIR